MFSIAFVLYKDLNVDPKRIEIDFKKMWDEDLNVQYTFDSMKFNYKQFDVVISFVNEPINKEEMERVAKHNPLFENGIKIAKNHKCHAVVAIKGVSSHVERYKALTKILASMAMSYNAKAIYLGAQQLLYSDTFIVEQAKLLHNGYLPVQSWVYIGFYSYDGAFYAYSQGMKEFNRLEIEIMADDKTPQELHQTILNFIFYHLASHRQYEDGEVLCLNYDCVIEISHRWSDTLKEDTLLLRFI